MRILDLTRLIPGGYGTLLLSELGAAVLKVEDPHGGDGLRLSPPITATGESGLFTALCRGKSSCAVDLRTAGGLQILLRLVGTSDVLIDSFRPGVLDRLGLGAEVLHAANPRLVHVSLTAYGSAGRASLPGHDLNAQGYAGLLPQSRHTNGTPVLPAVPVADVATGLHCALAVLAGLRVAQRDSSGFRADVALVDSALSLGFLAHSTAATTASPPPYPDMLTGGLACYGTYRCADGLDLVCGALEPKFFQRILQLLDRPELADVQFAPGEQGRLRAELEAVFASAPRQHWLTLLEYEQTCVSPVLDAYGALRDLEAIQRGVVMRTNLSDGSDFPVTRAVPWLAGRTQDPPGRAPTLGQDTDSLLISLGISGEEVRALREAHVVA